MVLYTCVPTEGELIAFICASVMDGKVMPPVVDDSAIDPVNVGDAVFALALMRLLSEEVSVLPPPVATLHSPCPVASFEVQTYPAAALSVANRGAPTTCRAEEGY